MLLNGLVVSAAMEGVPRAAGTNDQRFRSVFGLALRRYRRRFMRGSKPFASSHEEVL
jgi:hypothetical protein